MTWEDWKTISHAVSTGKSLAEFEMNERKNKKINVEWYEEKLKEFEGARKILDEVEVEF